MEKFSNPAGCILLAHIFLLAGLNKLGAGYAPTQAYMEAMGVPGILLPLVILLEIAGAVALVVSLQTRWVALALAGFSLASAAILHANFADQMQMIMFMKNFAIAGGLIVVAGNGAGEPSLDGKLRLRRAGAGLSLGVRSRGRQGWIRRPVPPGLRRRRE